MSYAAGLGSLTKLLRGMSKAGAKAADEPAIKSRWLAAQEVPDSRYLNPDFASALSRSGATKLGGGPSASTFPAGLEGMSSAIPAGHAALKSGGLFRGIGGRGLLKLGGAGLGTGLGVAALMNMKFGGDETPLSTEEFDGSAVGDTAGSTTGLDYGTGASSAYGDAYDSAAKRIDDYYNQLLDQSAQDTARREQQIKDIYGEQQAYQQSLIDSMGADEDLRRAQAQDINSEMMQEYENMRSGLQMSGAGNNVGSQGVLIQEALADRANDEAYASQLGQGSRDLMRSMAATTPIRMARQIEGLQGQGAEDQRALRNKQLESINDLSMMDMNRMHDLDKLQLQNRLEIEREGTTGNVVPPESRMESLGVLVDQWLDGANINELPPNLQSAIQNFLTTGNADALNFVVRVFQSYPDNWRDRVPKQE